MELFIVTSLSPPEEMESPLPTAFVAVTMLLVIETVIACASLLVYPRPIAAQFPAVPSVVAETMELAIEMVPACFDQTPVPMAAAFPVVVAFTVPPVMLML